MLKKLFYTLVS